MAKVLSNRDLDLIQKLLDEGKRRPGGRPAIREMDYPAPDVYVARTPESGIPAIDQDVGSGHNDYVNASHCQVYQLLEVGTGGTFEAVDGFTVPVYNLGTSAVTGGTWVIVVRDKFGGWYVVEPNDPDCNAVSITETDLRCEGGLLNKYNRNVNLRVVSGCLTKDAEDWVLVESVAECEDAPAFTGTGTGSNTCAWGRDCYGVRFEGVEASFELCSESNAGDLSCPSVFDSEWRLTRLDEELYTAYGLRYPGQCIWGQSKEFCGNLYGGVAVVLGGPFLIDPIHPADPPTLVVQLFGSGLPTIEIEYQAAAPWDGEAEVILYQHLGPSGATTCTDFPTSVTITRCIDETGTGSDIVGTGTSACCYPNGSPPETFRFQALIPDSFFGPWTEGTLTYLGNYGWADKWSGISDDGNWEIELACVFALDRLYVTMTAPGPRSISFYLDNQVDCSAPCFVGSGPEYLETKTGPEEQGTATIYVGECAGVTGTSTADDDIGWYCVIEAAEPIPDACGGCSADEVPDTYHCVITGFSGGVCVCESLNGTWTLTYRGPTTCTWAADTGDNCPAVGGSETWIQLFFNPTAHLGLFAIVDTITNYVQYDIDGAFDCTGENTFLPASTTNCAAAPASITLIPGPASGPGGAQTCMYFGSSAALASFIAGGGTVLDGPFISEVVCSDYCS